MKFDSIERIGQSEVQHGKLNDRVYLSKLKEQDLNAVFNTMEGLVKKRKYGKIVSKVPKWALNYFLDRGYRVEAEIPKLYRGNEDGFFVAGYPDKARFFQPEKQERFIQSVRTIALATTDNAPKVSSEGCEVRRLKKADLSDLAELNQRVFESYPYPIFRTTYLEECLSQRFQFYGLYVDSRLLEAAFVLVNKEEDHAEIIDFAIPSDYKGQNRSYHLVAAIKSGMEKEGIRTLFSGVRATSYGLNITFKKQDFRYGGTLVNNARVGDTLQSMNIWYYHKP